MMVDGICPECGGVISLTGVTGGMKITKCMTCGRPCVYVVKFAPMVKTYKIMDAAELVGHPLSNDGVVEGSPCLDDLGVYTGKGDGLKQVYAGNQADVVTLTVDPVQDSVPEISVPAQVPSFKKEFIERQLAPSEKKPEDKPMLGSNMPKEKLVQGSKPKGRPKVQTIAEEFADVPYKAIEPDSSVQYRILGNLGIEMRYMGAYPQIIGWDKLREYSEAAKEGSIVERIKEHIGTGSPNRLTAVNRTVKALNQGLLPEVAEKLKA